MNHQLTTSRNVTSKQVVATIAHAANDSFGQQVWRRNRDNWSVTGEDATVGSTEWENDDFTIHITGWGPSASTMR